MNTGYTPTIRREIIGTGVLTASGRTVNVVEFRHENETPGAVVFNAGIYAWFPLTALYIPECTDGINPAHRCDCGNCAIATDEIPY